MPAGKSFLVGPGWERSQIAWTDCQKTPERRPVLREIKLPEQAGTPHDATPFQRAIRRDRKEAPCMLIQEPGGETPALLPWVPYPDWGKGKDLVENAEPIRTRAKQGLIG